MFRIIFGLDSRSHVDFKNLRELNWLNIPDRVSYFKLLHIFRIRYKIAPAYLLPNFTAISEAHGYNTRCSIHNFQVSRDLSLAPNSFAFTAIKHWNNLPNPVK